MKRTSIRLLLSVFIFISLINVQSAVASASLPTDSTAVPSTEIVDNALKEFKSLSKQERKARIKEARLAYKAMKKDNIAAAEAVGSTPQWVLVLLAILLPPLAVYLHQGEINNKFWISLVLTVLGWLPGVIYALVVILGGA